MKTSLFLQKKQFIPSEQSIQELIRFIMNPDIIIIVLNLLPLKAWNPMSGSPLN